MVFYQIYTNYLQSSNQSKAYSSFSIFYSILLFIISIIWIYLLKEERFWGKIYGQLVILIFLYVYLAIKISRIITINLKSSYVTYALRFSLPLIPHTLSGFVLAYFDRIIINQLTDSTATGLYSFAYSIGTIMHVFIIATSKAWQPLFFQNVNNKDYRRIDQLSVNYAKYVYFFACGLILFSKEIIIVMADKSYHTVLYIVPIIVFGYVFVFLYSIYFQYCSYLNRTEFISINTLISAAVNIGLNYLLIPKLGYSIAATTTLLSYMLLFVLHRLTAIKVYGKDVVSLKVLLPDMIVVLVAVLLNWMIGSFLSNIYGVILIKLILLGAIGKYLWRN